MKKLVLSFLILLLILFIGAGAYIWKKVDSIDKLSLSVSETTQFEVAKGSSLYKVVENLRKYGDIDRLGFKLWLQLHPEFSKVQSGVYEIKPNSRFVDVMELLVNGKVKQFSVTLIEGLTIAQWQTALLNAEGLKHDSEKQADLYNYLGLADSEFCANEYLSVEGCLLPDTYFYTYGTPSHEILKRAMLAMQTYIRDVWLTRFTDLPIHSQYEALILASIIEKETAVESERTEVAGVFVNRLNKNMRLQTDPTVIYGVGESYDGDITRKHLRTPTPYNTYVIKGLPITPIAMPNRASISAALFPALTDSLYFVATGDGGHKFSTNLRDHNNAVREYLKQRKLNINSNNSQ
jgi:UPF0755 protein